MCVCVCETQDGEIVMCVGMLCENVFSCEKGGCHEDYLTQGQGEISGVELFPLPFIGHLSHPLLFFQ